MNEITANLNNSECLREVNNLFHKDIYNVCTGAIFHIPYGTWDIISVGSLIILAMLVIFVFGFLVYTFITEII